jgi:hypothetical protein
LNFVLNTCTGVAAEEQLNLSWKFFNNQNDLESRFFVEVDDNRNFNNPKYKATVTTSGVVSSGSNAHVVPIVPGTDNSPCTAGTTCHLNYNKTYYWRVRVCETTRSGGELCSEDSSHNPVWYYYNTPNGGSTDKNAAIAVVTPPNPSPFPSFTRSPSSPTVGDVVSFTDASSCYTIQGTQSNCRDSSVNNYTWKFGTAGTNNVRGNTSWTFTSPGSPVVELKICDPYQCCSATQQVNISAPKNTTTPNYKEVPPF